MRSVDEECLFRRDGLASALVLFAGLLATAWTVVNVRRALSWAPSGGGIGAVSSGLFLELLLLGALLLVNLSVATAARRRGQLAERFRRAHFWVTVVYAAWAVASEIVFMRAYAAGADAFLKAAKVLAVVDAPFLPLQLFFASSFLAFVIGNPRIPTTRGGT